MAERLKDSEDLQLEALFSSEPVQDDGFSARIMFRVQRRMWVRRLSLPVAIAIGAVIAAKPLLQLAELVPKNWGRRSTGLCEHIWFTVGRYVSGYYHYSWHHVARRDDDDWKNVGRIMSAGRSSAPSLGQSGK